MATITTLLYPEWMKQQQSFPFSAIHDDTPVIHIFGSFFDPISFSFIVEFIPSFLKSLTMWDKAIQPQLMIVFLPICKNSVINMYFKNLLENFIDALISPFSVTGAMKQWSENQITSITSKAHSLFQQLYSHSSLNEFSQAQFSFKNFNEFYFGSLTADFLTSFSILPVIFIGSQLYNGIPLNYSLAEFVKKLLAEDVLELSAFLPLI